VSFLPLVAGNFVVWRGLWEVWDDALGTWGFLDQETFVGNG